MLLASLRSAAKYSGGTRARRSMALRLSVTSRYRPAMTNRRADRAMAVLTNCLIITAAVSST